MILACDVSADAMELLRRRMKNHVRRAAMIRATTPTTPTTIPAIAPPDRPEDFDLLFAPDPSPIPVWLATELLRVMVTSPSDLVTVVSAADVVVAVEEEDVLVEVTRVVDEVAEVFFLLEVVVVEVDVCGESQYIS